MIAVNKQSRIAMILLPLVLISLSAWVPASGHLPNSSEQNGDVGHGKALYDQQCLKCHAPDEDKEGPRLRGIYGSKAATLSRFNYSDALRQSKIVWDSISLNKWLADPDGFIPDTDMRARIDSPSDRADLIAYLKALTK